MNHVLIVGRQLCLVRWFQPAPKPEIQFLLGDVEGARFERLIPCLDPCEEDVFRYVEEVKHDASAELLPFLTAAPTLVPLPEPVLEHHVQAFVEQSGGHLPLQRFNGAFLLQCVSPAWFFRHRPYHRVDEGWAAWG
jgi:hypothetical protein